MHFANRLMPDDRVSLSGGMAEALTSHPLKSSKIQMRVVAEGFGWQFNHIARLIIVRKCPLMSKN